MCMFVMDTHVLGRTRFAFSPLSEATQSLRLLGEPHATSLHAPWLRMVRESLGSVDMPLLGAVAPPGPWLPESLMASAETPSTSIDRQLAELADIDPDQIIRDMDAVWGDRPRPQRLRELLADPRRAPSRLAEALWEYWGVAIGPYWPRMCAVLEDDVAYRVSRLVNGGIYDMLADLHPDVMVEGGRLRVGKPHSDEQTFAAERMVLTPSVFTWPGLALGDGSDGQFLLTYGARGVGRVWEGVGDVGRADPEERLGALLGRTRAIILEHTAVPMTTTQLARALGQSPGSINQHLSVLRDASLVTSWRSGRSVFYRQTPIAQSMIAAQQAAQGGTRVAQLGGRGAPTSFR